MKKCIQIFAVTRKMPAIGAVKTVKLHARCFATLDNFKVLQRAAAVVTSSAENVNSNAVRLPIFRRPKKRDNNNNNRCN